jgi:hypothetical protein
MRRRDFITLLGGSAVACSVIAFDVTSGAIKGHFQRRRKNAC